MVGSQSMLKSRMGCPRINGIGHAELSDVAQTLKPGMGDNVQDQFTLYGYETVQRVVYNFAPHDNGRPVGSVWLG